MRTTRRALLGSIALVAIASGPLLAQESVSADVVHVWTSAGERAQVESLGAAFAARGGEWVDAAVPPGGGGRGAIGEAINRILAGDPPSAAQIASGQDHLDLIRQEMLTPIDDVAAANGWAEVMPEAVLEAITYDGHVYLAPVAIHAPNWLWYNAKVLEAAGVEPPARMDDTFFETMDTIRDAGYIPFALSGTPSALRFLFEAFFIDAAGPDVWYAVWRDKDPEAMRGPEMLTAFERFKRVRDYADEGYSGRIWNQTLDLVLSDQAAFDVLGDWAIGTFNAAGKQLGTDYGCVLAGDVMIIHADFFGFPVQTDQARSDGQKLLAEVMADADTVSDLAIIKGSIPPRTDADVSQLNDCSQKAYEAFNDPARLVGNSRTFITPSSVGDIHDLLMEYMDTPEMTAEEAVERMAEILEND